MLLLTFNRKNVFMFIFFIVFFCSNARKFCALFIEFMPSMTYSSKERSSHIAPSPQPHPLNQKSSLETSVHFPITITVCKHWSKFVTCSPSPSDCWGVSHSQRHSYYGFRLCGKKWLSQNFDPLNWGKNERGRGPRCPPIVLVT